MRRLLAVALTLTVFVTMLASPAAAASGLEQAPAREVALLGDADALNLPDTRLGESQLDAVFNIVFTLAGSIATIFIIVGALRYALATGDPQKLEQAKKTVLYAIVGLVVTVLAFALVNFIIGQTPTS